MATIPAPTQQAPPSPSLWPAPVFVLGVAALVAVCLGRPFLHGHDGRIKSAIADARAQLDKPDGDAQRALELARSGLQSGPSRAEAAFLAGSACVRLAEKDPAHAASHWADARQYLEQAEAGDLRSEEDRAALAYRLAAVEFHGPDGDAGKVVARLEACAELVDPRSRAGAYDLLTRAYLRLPPTPEILNKALEANRRLREVPDLSGADLAAAQLMGGELLLRLKTPDKARAELELIKEPDAAPDVFVRSRLLLGHCHQDVKRYDLAVPCYLAALRDGRAAVPQPAQVYYNLGLCHRQLGQAAEAAAAWKECVRQAQQGDEAQAAHIVLAELSLIDAPAPPPSAAEELARAVKGVASAADWKNPLVGLERAREVFENALAAFRRARRYDLALKALEPYVRIALPRRSLEWRAVLSAEWARSARDKAGDGEPLPEGEVVALFRQAAKAYSDAAELPGVAAADAARHLWDATTCHLAARDGKEAAQKLEKLVTMDLEPARLGEAWYLLGEEYRSAGDGQKAESAYQKCLEYVTRFAYLARYQLAMAALNRGEIDAARDALKYNLSQLTWDSDAEAMSQTLFALCGLLYRRGDYRAVVRHYAEALQHYSNRFPDVGALTQARYQLANSYYQIASQENQRFLLSDNQSAEMRAHFQKMHRKWLSDAAEEFASLDGFLESPDGQAPLVAQALTLEQRTQVPFVTGKCWFNLGQYEKALAVYERLIKQHDGKVEGLDALGGAVSCHAAMGQVSNVRQRLLQIERAIQTMPPEVKEPWEEWLKLAKQGLKDVKET